MIVNTITSPVIQIQTAHIPESGNNAAYVELIALCEDGSIWVNFRSNGYANVPADGRWYNIQTETR